MYLHCVLTLLALFCIHVSECLQCFNCTNINDPNSCKGLVECLNDESCVLQTVHSGNEVLYNMGCQNNQFCSSFPVDPSGIIGRSVQTRQQNRCHECCRTDYCNEQLCPHREVHGNWSDWSTWSNCSVTCGVGVRKKTRTCTNPKPARSGNDCVGESSEYTGCFKEPCSVIDGGWASWGSWERCSVTCGVGQKLSRRTCTNPSPTLYGKTCEGDYTDYAVCVNTPCHAVAFTAYGISILSDLVNRFTGVISKEGNAYNIQTGHFTAPVDGIYHFTTQICANNNLNFQFFIKKGSATMSVAEFLKYSENFSANGPTCTSASCSVKLTRNEHVWVRMDRQYTAEISTDAYNSFTGMLVQEL